MTFDIVSRGLVFREVVTCLIVVPPNNPPHNDAPTTQTHNIGFNTTCWIMSFVALSQNQLVMKETHSSLL